MIQRVEAQGLPFDAVACDDLYGRSTWLRDKLAGAGITYMADVPRTTRVLPEEAGAGGAGTRTRPSGTENPPVCGC